MQVSDCRILSAAEQPLAQALASMLDGAEYAQFAVGYLFVGGLSPLIGALSRLDHVDLLMGNVVNRLTQEQILEDASERTTAAVDDEGDAFAKVMRDERDRAAALTALNLRRTLEHLPRNDDTKRLIPDLAKLIAGGRLRVRLLTQGRLHAKVTLIGYPTTHPNAPGIAVVGSSNVTLPTDHELYPHPDIDVLLAGQLNFRILTDWFEAHWSVAQDFQKELFEELGRCWPLG